jgi:PhnB protein
MAKQAKKAGKKAKAPRKAKKVSPIPAGYSTVTPYLVIRNAGAAIDFYKRAFGAKEIVRMPGPDGKTIMHAELKIGDSFVMLSEEFPDMGNRSPQALGGSPVSLLIYTKNVDTMFDQAIRAGATSQMPPQDMFWGDRWSKLSDPYGHVWQIATHKEDVSAQEMAKRTKAAFAEMASQKSGG